MRLVILTQYYPPEVGAPQSRLADLAARMVRMGHEVTVLTAMPNYPAGRVHDAYRGRLYARETIDGVKIHRAWVFASTSRSIPLRLLNYFSFVFTSLIVGAVQLRRADFLLVESPPLFLGISAVALAKLVGARLIFNVADLFSDGLIAARIVRDGAIVAATRWLERWLCQVACVTTGQTPGIVDVLRRLAPSATVRLLTNGVDVWRFTPDAADQSLLEEFGLGGRFVVAYAGVHGHSQVLECVVDAAAMVRDCPDVVIAFFGEGPVKADLKRRAAVRELTNVRFFDQVPGQRMPGLVPLWHVGLVPFFNTDVGRSARPSKLFELMSAAVPILLSGPKGDASAIVEAANAGLCVEPENAAAIADGIRRLARDPDRRVLGANGRRYVMQHYDRDVIVREFAQYLQSRLVSAADSAPVTSHVS